MLQSFCLLLLETLVSLLPKEYFIYLCRMLYSVVANVKDIVLILFPTLHKAKRVNKANSELSYLVFRVRNLKIECVV